VPVFVGVPSTAEPPIWPDDADLAGDGTLTRRSTRSNRFGQTTAYRRTPSTSACSGLPRTTSTTYSPTTGSATAGQTARRCWTTSVRSASTRRRYRCQVARTTSPLASAIAISTAPGAAAIRGLYASPGHRKDLMGPYTHRHRLCRTGRRRNLAPVHHVRHRTLARHGELCRLLTVVRLVQQPATTPNRR
jgi:hypothetical protein